VHEKPVVNITGERAATKVLIYASGQTAICNGEAAAM
jgi:hypothetical protein